MDLNFLLGQIVEVQNGGLTEARFVTLSPVIKSRILLLTGNELAENDGSQNAVSYRLCLHVIALDV